MFQKIEVGTRKHVILSALGGCYIGCIPAAGPWLPASSSPIFRPSTEVHESPTQGGVKVFHRSIQGVAMTQRSSSFKRAGMQVLAIGALAAGLAFPLQAQDV